MRQFIGSQRLEQGQHKTALRGAYEIIGIIYAVRYALKADDFTEAISTKELIELRACYASKYRHRF